MCMPRRRRRRRLSETRPMVQREVRVEVRYHAWLACADIGPSGSDSDTSDEEGEVGSGQAGWLPYSSILWRQLDICTG